MMHMRYMVTDPPPHASDWLILRRLVVNKTLFVVSFPSQENRQTFLIEDCKKGRRTLSICFVNPLNKEQAVVLIKRIGCCYDPGCYSGVSG